MASIKDVLNFELFIHEENTITSSLMVLVIVPDRSLVLDMSQSKIILYYNGLPISTDWGKVMDILEDIKEMGTLTKAYLQEEVFVVEGNYRHLENHVSIQQDFPLLYNVGHEGCTPSETPENHAIAKQLKTI